MFQICGQGWYLNIRCKAFADTELHPRYRGVAIDHSPRYNRGLGGRESRRQGEEGTEFTAVTKADNTRKQLDADNSPEAGSMQRGSTIQVSQFIPPHFTKIFFSKISRFRNIVFQTVNSIMIIDFPFFSSASSRVSRWLCPCW